MSAKHTPGPWLVVEEKNAKTISDWYIQITDTTIGIFPYKRMYSDDELSSGLVIDHTQLANARLIAAAPELLEALEKALPDLSGEYLLRARAAIAKATGQDAKA